MTITHVDTPSERFSYDTATGVGSIEWRAASPPKDTPLAQLDGHFLGARVEAPIKKPWPDTQASVHEAGSSGAVYAIVAEAARPWSEVGVQLTANSRKDLARPVNFLGKQVCMGGGATLPCSKTIPKYQWCCCHHFRPIRHLVNFLRFGWPSDEYMAKCALTRVFYEPTLKDVPKQQREIAWPLLLEAEAYKTPLWTSACEATTNDLIQRLWKAPRGENYVCLHTDPPDDHLGQCSWQVALLVKAFGRLLRKGFPDPDKRLYQLYKAAVKALDSMKKDGTWVKDWQPVDRRSAGGVVLCAAGTTMENTTPYGGTTLWTACAYAESLALLTAAADERRAYLQAWMAKSNALKPQDVNFVPDAYALLKKLVG